MTLRERLRAKETRVGKFLKDLLAPALLICSILGGANEYLAVLPPDFIPQYLKTSVVVAGVISYIAGKLTVNKDLNESK